MGSGPDRDAVGRVAAEHLPPILYALEVCAVSMEQAGRSDDAVLYREIARRLADASGGGGGAGGGPGA